MLRVWPKKRAFLTMARGVRLLPGIAEHRSRSWDNIRDHRTNQDNQGSIKSTRRFIITAAAFDYVPFGLLSVFSPTSKPILILIEGFLFMQYMCI